MIEYREWGLYEGLCRTRTLRIVLPPVDGAGGSGRVRGVARPANNGHGRPEHSIEPGRYDQQRVRTNSHFLAFTGKRHKYGCLVSLIDSTVTWRRWIQTAQSHENT